MLPSAVIETLDFVIVQKAEKVDIPFFHQPRPLSSCLSALFIFQAALSC